MKTQVTNFQNQEGINVVVLNVEGYSFSVASWYSMPNETMESLINRIQSEVLAMITMYQTK